MTSFHSPKRICRGNQRTSLEKEKKEKKKDVNNLIYQNNVYYSSQTETFTSLSCDTINFEDKTPIFNASYDRQYMKEDNVLLILISLIEDLNSRFFATHATVKAITVSTMRTVLDGYLALFDFGDSQIAIIYSVSNWVQVTILQYHVYRSLSHNDVVLLANRLRALDTTGLQLPVNLVPYELARRFSMEAKRRIESQDKKLHFHQILHFIASPDSLITII